MVNPQGGGEWTHVFVETWRVDAVGGQEEELEQPFHLGLHVFGQEQRAEVQNLQRFLVVALAQKRENIVEEDGERLGQEAVAFDYVKVLDQAVQLHVGHEHSGDALVETGRVPSVVLLLELLDPHALPVEKLEHLHRRLSPLLLAKERKWSVLRAR